MDRPKIELHFLPATSILRETRQALLLMWTWDACFCFVGMKCKTLGRKMALKSTCAAVCEMSFHQPVGCICVGVGIILKSVGKRREMKLRGERRRQRKEMR